MIQLKHLNFKYNKKSDNLAVNDVDFDICDGECLVILGPNGAGKSTLMCCVNGINKPLKGSVINIDGKLIEKYSKKELARKIGYVPQNIKYAPMSVFDAVLLGRTPCLGANVKRTDLEATAKVIHELELDDFSDKNVCELSGGERQKVAVATALATGSPYLLFDEPTSALDLKNQKDISDLIIRVTKDYHRTVVASMHDIGLAHLVGDKFLIIKNGKVVAYGGNEILTSELLSEVYEMPLEVHFHHNGKYLSVLPVDKEEKSD